MKVSILMPYRYQNAVREKNYRWVKRFYETLLPQVELFVGTCNTELFSRAQAVNNAAKRASGDVYVIADSDMFFDPAILPQAVDLLNEYAWVVPYYTIYNLHERSSNELLALKPQWPIPISLESDPCEAGKFEITGGVNLVTREKFESIGGLDERFLGWGSEDNAFYRAMNTLFGYYYRMNNDFFHFWHVPEGPNSNPTYHYSMELQRRYEAADGNPEAMRRLINERK